MSTNIIGMLRGAAGEIANTPGLHRWAQKVSTGVDNLVDLVALLSGGGLLPASGTTTGARPLSGYSTALLQTGDEVFVQGINEVYYFDASSALAADGLNVVDAVGPGQFLRLNSVIVQADWYVDPAGNDQNPGTAAAPLKTLAELTRRFQGRVINPGLTTVNVYVAAGTFDESLTLNITTSTFSQLVIIQGVMTEHFSGTIDAYTHWNSATSTRATLTDAAADFTTKQRRIRLTSGVSSGACAWFNSGTANIANVSQFDVAGGSNFGTGSAAPSAGDTYSLESCATTISGYSITVNGPGRVRVRDLHFVSSATSRRWGARSGEQSSISLSLEFFGCSFEKTGVNTIAASFYEAQWTCSIMIGAFSLNGTGTLKAMLFCHIAFVGGSYWGSENLVFDGNLTTNVSLLVSNGATFESYGTSAGICHFDCIASGSNGIIDLSDYGKFVMNSTNVRWWGSGNTAMAKPLKVDNGSQFTYVTKPAITGAVPGNDIELAADALIAWAAVPAKAAAAYDNACVTVRA